MILASLAALGATVVAFVLIPIFSEERRKTVALTDAQRELLDLEEKKVRLYDAITDLDFEKAAGKVSQADFDRARDDYLAQTAEVMARIDALAPAKAPEGSAPGENDPEKSGKSRDAKRPGSPDDASPRAGARACGSCGATSPAAAKFCVQCGEPLVAGCSSCGEELPEGARFCPGCGEKTA